MQKRTNHLRGFLRCDRGVTAVEFAFISPVLFLLIFGILEFAMIFLAGNMLENAVSNAARTGKTGYVESGLSREQTLLNEISSRVGSFLDPAEISLTEMVYESLDQIGGEPYTDANTNGSHDTGETYTDTNANGVWDAELGTAGLGDAGKVVVYTISYDWNMMTPFLDNLIGDNGVFTISTRVVIKNEPYTDSST